MLDINFIKENLDEVKKVMEEKKVKGVDVDVDKLMEIHKKYIDALKKVENQRNLRNKMSADISKVKDKRKKTYP